MWMQQPIRVPHVLPAAAVATDGCEKRGLTGALSRRHFLSRSVFSAGVAAIGARFVNKAFACSGGASASSGGRVLHGHGYGELLPANADGLQLPPGFSSRIIGTADTLVEGTGYVWHRAPDGGACFATVDGGWVYVSNAELDAGAGGVGAIRFAADGRIADAYRICDGTTRNCAGGPTPWGTWITCEEIENGRAVECDPLGVLPQRNLDALGWLYREAIAVDPVAGHVYHSEDRIDGKLYRSVHPNYPDLGTGTLQAAIVGPGAPGDRRTLSWVDVPNPNPGHGEPTTRAQVPQATNFVRGEGMWYHQGFVYFCTTSDERVWAIDCARQTVQAIYDANATTPPDIAREIDNITVSATGELLVAEDSDDLQIVLISSAGEALPILQIAHAGSEVAGPAFSPDGSRLYFSSQRGPSAQGNHGVTYEVRGPFRQETSE